MFEPLAKESPRLQVGEDVNATLLNWNNDLIHQVASCFPDLDQLQRASTTARSSASNPSTFDLLPRIAMVLRRGFVLADQIDSIETSVGCESVVSLVVDGWEIYDDESRSRLRDLASKASRMLEATDTDCVDALKYSLFLPSLIKRKNFYAIYRSFLHNFSTRILEADENWTNFSLKMQDFSEVLDFDCDFTDSPVSEGGFFSKIDGEHEPSPQEVVNWSEPLGREVW